MTSSEVSSKGNHMKGDMDTFPLSSFNDKNDVVGDSRAVPVGSGAGKGTSRSF